MQHGLRRHPAEPGNDGVVQECDVQHLRRFTPRTEPGRNARRKPTQHETERLRARDGVVPRALFLEDARRLKRYERRVVLTRTQLEHTRRFFAEAWGERRTRLAHQLAPSE